MKTTNIVYTFERKGEVIDFNFVFRESDFSLINEIEVDGEPWIKLDFHKCSHCPLNGKEHSVCPLAQALHGVMKKMSFNLSYEKTFVEIETKNRTVSKLTDMQEAFRSMLGLVISTCGCPYTTFFRPMARFHLPFSDINETIYRALSMFLLAQHFRAESDHLSAQGINDLLDIYYNITIVDEYICKRLKAVRNEDASVNAITILHSLYESIKYAKERGFERLRPLFHAYL